jgi:hypothetical protein
MGPVFHSKGQGCGGSFTPFALVILIVVVGCMVLPMIEKIVGGG